jgi:hypothetical protein
MRYSISQAFLILLLLSATLSVDPSPPYPTQYSLSTAKPGSRQFMVITNWVDRLADFYRIDTYADGELLFQLFFLGDEQTGYDIDWRKGDPKCTIYNNRPDILKEWHDNMTYIGKTLSHIDGIECNLWNLTGRSYIVSNLASVKDNIPIEVWSNAVVASLYKNFTVGPAAVPKHVFNLPIKREICKK